MSGRLIPLTVPGPSTVNNMALYSVWYGPVQEPSTVSGKAIPLTVTEPCTVSNVALYSEWYGPVLGPSTVGVRLIPLAVLRIARLSPRSWAAGGIRMRLRRPWGLRTAKPSPRSWPLRHWSLSDRGRPLADVVSRKSGAVNWEHLAAAPRSLAKRSRVLRNLQGVILK